MTLPSQVQTSNSSLLNCVFSLPLNFQLTKCEALSTQQIKLTIGSQSLSSYFSFNIVASITNPPSTTYTDSLIFQTFNNDSNMLDQQSSGILIATTNDSLSLVEMIANATVFSGDQNTLQFTLRTKNPVLPNGQVQVQFPYLSTSPKDNIYMSMVNQNALECQDLTTNLVTQCSWNSATQTLSLTQIIGPLGKPAASLIWFQVMYVTNPISTDVSATLTIRTTDSVGGVIDQSEVILTATQPSQITDSLITADSSLVQDVTRYQIQFKIGVPIASGGCTMTIYLPYPDFEISQSSITDVQGFGLFGKFRSYTYQLSSADNSITILDACQGYIKLHGIAATVYIVGLKNPNVAKLTDPISIKIWNIYNGQIAQLTTANSPQFQITPGSPSNVNLTTSTSLINSLVDFNVTFQFQNQALSDQTTTMAHIEVTLTDLNFPISQYVRVKSTNLPGQQVKVESFNATLNKITVLVTYPQILSNTSYFIIFSNIQMALSVQNMGPIIIELSMQWFTGSSYVYYPIDNGSFTGLVKTTKGQFLVANIFPASFVVYDLTSYSFQILIQNSIPQFGYILITLPPEIYIEGESIACTYQSLDTECSFDTITGLAINVTGPFLQTGMTSSMNSLADIQVLNIRNPRSMKTTGIFTFQSFDQLSQLIDFYSESNTAVSMNAPSSFIQSGLTSISSLRVSDTGVTLQFTVTLAMPLYSGDYLLISMPSSGEIQLPTMPMEQCASTEQAKLLCAVTNEMKIQIQLSNPVEALKSITIVLQPFVNPSSGVQTAPFQIGLHDIGDFDMAETNPSSLDSLQNLSIQMTLPHLITSGALLKTDTDLATSAIVITIQFKVNNNIPQGSNLVITYPFQLTPNATRLGVISPQSTSLNNVTLSSRQIVGDNFFSIMISGGSVLELQIAGFTNPNTSQPTDQFIVELFTPDGLVIDRLQQAYNLSVQSKCDYPCKDCIPHVNTSVCTACMTSDMSPLILLEVGQCVRQCRVGYYQIGNQCKPCDVSCLSCEVSPLICTACPTDKPQYQYMFNNRCVSTCDSGYFQNGPDQQCQACTSNCLTCNTAINACGSCLPGTYLQAGTCRQTCPADYYIGNATTWTCDRCNSTCQTCQNTVNECTTCQPDYHFNTVNSTCFMGQCPSGITAEDSPLICTACSNQCSTCNSTNSTLCLTCDQNLYLNPDQDCVASCKSNQAVVVSADEGISRCVDCTEGCSKCLDGSPDVCQICESPLVNFNFTQCMATCPDGFAVNALSGNCLNTTINCLFGYRLNATDQCDLYLRQCKQGYMLNSMLDNCIPVPGLYIPFPVLGLVVLSTLIVLIRIRIRRSPNTKVLPTLIALWSVFELPLYLLQAAFAAWIENWFNVVCILIALIFHFPLNYIAAKIILPESLYFTENDQIAQQDPSLETQIDYSFKHWAGDHQSFLRSLRNWSLYYNHKLLRLLYCGYLDKPQYLAAFDRPDIRMYKPLIKIAAANILTTYLLVVIADVTALKTTVVWGYQFTIFCIESLVLTLGITILEIADYCYSKDGNILGYFKVAAGKIGLENVYGAADENDSNSSDQGGNGPSRNTERVKRQRSMDRHVNLLKQLNEELGHRKIYSGNFDRLAEYGLQQQTLSKQSFYLSDDEEVEDGNNSSERCMSTQNHYAVNKGQFYDYDQNDVCSLDDHIRPWRSLMSETEFPDPQYLANFRLEFPMPLPEDQLNQTKTLDYNASFHILDANINDEDSESSYKLKRPVSNYLFQQPPRYNLNDVMGHFETDQRGNMIIIKRTKLEDASIVHGEVLIDALGRRVNKRGYLIDEARNIVSKFGELVVAHELLDPFTHDIPPQLFQELFIPKQISRGRHRKHRLNTAKTRGPVHSSLLHQNRTGSSSAKTRDMKNKNSNIQSDGRINIEDVEMDKSQQSTQLHIGRGASRVQFSENCAQSQSGFNRDPEQSIQINIEMKNSGLPMKKGKKKTGVKHQKASVIPKIGAEQKVNAPVVSTNKPRQLTKVPENKIKKKIIPLVDMDQIIREVTKPKIPKMRASSMNKVAPLPPKRKPIDPTLYRVHLDEDDNLWQNNHQQKPQDEMVEQSINNSHYDHRLENRSLMASLDHPFDQIMAKQTILNMSGRQIVKDSSHERYDFKSNFYHNPSNQISPSSSVNLQILHEGKKQNRISSAYSQDLTLLMNKNTSVKEVMPEKDDPMAQMKKIFNNRM